jgi:acetyl esterase/lipase
MHIATTLFILITACLLFFCTSVASAAGYVSADKTEVYKTIGEIKLKLHIFTPADHQASNKTPAIVFFHGGGWQRGHYYNYFHHAQHLKDRGMVCFVVEYRLKDKHNNEPIDCLKDAKSAMRFVRANAVKYGIDPNMIATCGASAGGQLAFMCSRADGINDENDDLSISPAPNLSWLHVPVLNTGPEGFSHSWVKKYWEAFSPHHNITEKSPPTFICIGDKDSVTPLPIAEKFIAEMKAQNVVCTIKVYPDGEHAVLNRREFPVNFYDHLIAGDEFLHQYGYIKEPLSTELRSWLRIKGGAQIIDVRSKAEFDAGHLDNAQFMPHEQIKELIAKTEIKKDDHIVLYCKSGGRSGTALETLKALGYTNAINAGGYEAMKKSKPTEYK